MGKFNLGDIDIPGSKKDFVDKLLKSKDPKIKRMGRIFKLLFISNYNLREVGELIGLSRERVRQIAAKGMTMYQIEHE